MLEQFRFIEKKTFRLVMQDALRLAFLHHHNGEKELLHKDYEQYKAVRYFLYNS